MKTKKYIVPRISVCVVDLEMEMFNASQNITLPKSADKTIASSDEILTKGRSLFGDEEPLFEDVW